jgi:hypothetical protein
MGDGSGQHQGFGGAGRANPGLGISIPGGDASSDDDDLIFDSQTPPWGGSAAAGGAGGGLGFGPGASGFNTPSGTDLDMCRTLSGEDVLSRHKGPRDYSADYWAEVDELMDDVVFFIKEAREQFATKGRGRVRSL